MAYTSPITKIAIGFFRADQNYKNVFSNNEWLTDNDRNHAKSEQADYFWGKMKHRWDASVSSNKYNIVRHDEYIDLPVTYAPTYSNCDYGMYCNQNLTVGSSNAKWIYFFITKTEYINSATTRLYIKTDVYQTYIFDVNFNPCKIIRNTVASDTWDYQKYADYLPTEAMQENWSYNMNAMISSYYVIATTAVIDEFEGNDLKFDICGATIDGLPYGYGLIICKSSATFKNEFKYFYRNGITDCIISISAVPVFVFNDKLDDIPASTPAFVFDDAVYYPSSGPEIPWAGQVNHRGVKVSFNSIFSSGKYTYPGTTTRPSTLISASSSSYTPKNKKLLTYPYCYAVLDMWGKETVLEFDKMDNDFSIVINSHLSASTNFELDVKNYNNKLFDFKDSSALDMIENLPYSSNQYFTYLNANANKLSAEMQAKQLTMATSLITAIGGTVAAAASGGTLAPVAIAGMAGMAASQGVSYANYVNNREATFEDLKSRADTTNMAATSTWGLHAAQSISPRFRKMQINKHFVEDIDRYFSCFGYALAKIEEPKLSNRTYWDYIQTENCIVEPYSISSDQGFMTNNELIEFANIFNNGVTVWHRETFDYSTFNNPIRT